MAHALHHTALKRVVGFLAWSATRPAAWRCRLLGRLIGPDRAVAMVGEAAARWPGLWGIYRRAAFYRSVLRRVGADVSIGFGSVITKADAELGDGVYIGRNCGIGRATLGDGVMLADAVQVLSGRHQHGCGSEQGGAVRDNPQRFERIAIGEGSWLGASCVVMADVGPRCVVAAGAVVVRRVAEEMRVAGVPARPIVTGRSSRNPQRLAA